MAERVLKPVPPTEDYEQEGWHCIYHTLFCHNPLDCYLVPRWHLKRGAALVMMRDSENLADD